MIRAYNVSDHVDVVGMWRALDSTAGILDIDGGIGDNKVYVASCKDKVVGFIAYADFVKYREIDALYVKPEYRRGGIATELMDYVDSGGFMRLLSNFQYKGAHKFYRSIGYKQNKPISGKNYFIFSLREHNNRNGILVACFIGFIAFVFFFIEHILTKKKS